MTDEPRVVAFGAREWDEEAPGVRARSEHVLGQRWAIVEYAEGTARREWCIDGHRGFVLEGEIEYEFDDGGARCRFARARPSGCPRAGATAARTSPPRPRDCS